MGRRAAHLHREGQGHCHPSALPDHVERPGPYPTWILGRISWYVSVLRQCCALLTLPCGYREGLLAAHMLCSLSCYSQWVSCLTLSEVRCLVTVWHLCLWHAVKKPWLDLGRLSLVQPCSQNSLLKTVRALLLCHCSVLMPLSRLFWEHG